MNAASWIDARTHDAVRTEQEPLLLAKRLGERLGELPHAAHELRLARALMFDVIELLESVRPR